MSQSSVLVDGISSACLEKEKKKKKETHWGLFSQGRTFLAGCAAWDFPGC
jgi:hypothetical protein